MEIVVIVELTNLFFFFFGGGVGVGNRMVEMDILTSCSKNAYISIL